MTSTARRRGLSIRLKMTLSYAGFLMVAWTLFVLVLMFVLHYLPDANLVVAKHQTFAPGRSDLVETAVPLLLVGTAVLAVIGLAGGWFLAGRMLRPLQAISTAVTRAATGSLAHRIELDGPDDELRRLADGLDLMLDRLESAFAEQRRFTANASHELRTPSAVMKTMLEVARVDPSGRDVDQLIDRMLEMNARSIATVEALLRLARVDQLAAGGEPLTGVRCDLARLVRVVLDREQAAIERAGIDVRLHLREAYADGDPELLDRLVANLIVNACRHNSGDGAATIVVTTEYDRGEPILIVENSGDRLDPALVPTLIEPFVRARGRAGSSAEAGSGLGLSIVASIARAHHARLELHPRTGGGLRVRIAFRAPRTASCSGATRAERGRRQRPSTA